VQVRAHLHGAQAGQGTHGQEQSTVLGLVLELGLGLGTGPEATPAVMEYCSKLTGSPSSLGLVQGRG